MFATYKLLINTIKNHKYSEIFKSVCEDDQLIAKLSTLFGVQFRKDWVGRVYAVINPAIFDGKFDQGQIFEYTNGGIDTTEHAKKWIMDRMSTMEEFMINSQILDIIGFNLKQLDDSGNYLFMLYPVTLPAALKWVKPTFFELGTIMSAILGYFIIA